MKEQLNNLEVLGRDHQAIRHAIARINLLTGKPGGDDWPERFRLEKLSGQEFLDSAVLVGKAAQAFKEQTLPRLIDQEKQIGQKVANLEGQVAQIQQFAESGFLDQAVLTRAQEILQEVKEPKPSAILPTVTLTNAFPQRAVENPSPKKPLGRNEQRRRRKEEIAQKVAEGLKKAGDKKEYDIKDVAVATGRTNIKNLRALVNDMKKKDSKLVVERTDRLRFKPKVFEKLVERVLKSRVINAAKKVESKSREITTTLEGHTIPQFQKTGIKKIADLMIEKRRNKERVYLEELDSFCPKDSKEKPRHWVTTTVHYMGKRYETHGWIVDSGYEYNRQEQTRKSYYFLRRHDEKPLGDNATVPLAPIPPAQIVLPPAGEVFEAVSIQTVVQQPTEASATDNEIKRWLKDHHMPEKEHYVTEDFVRAYGKAKYPNKPIGKNESMIMSARIKEIRKKDPSIKPKHLPNENKNRDYYSREDTQKIMTALLAIRIRKVHSSSPTFLLEQISTNGSEARRTIVPQSNAGLPAEISTKAGPNDRSEMDDALGPQIEEEWRNLKIDPQQKVLEELERTKQQLIIKATHVLLSHINNKNSMEHLERDLSTFLTDQLDPSINLAQETFILGKDTFIPFLVKRLDIKDLGTFFIDSFALRLEELWRKDIKSDTTGKEKDTIRICQELKKKDFNIQQVVYIIYNHFHISTIPEKYKYQPKTASPKK